MDTNPHPYGSFGYTQQPPSPWQAWQQSVLALAKQKRAAQAPMLQQLDVLKQANPEQGYWGRMWDMIKTWVDGQ